MNGTQEFKIEVINRQSGTDFEDRVEEKSVCTYRESRGVYYISYKAEDAHVLIKAGNDKVIVRRTGEYGFGTGAFPDLVYLWGRVLRPEHRPEYCAGKRGKADPHHTGTGGNHQKQRTAKGAPDEKSLQKILPGDPHCGERGV